MRMNECVALLLVVVAAWCTASPVNDGRGLLSYSQKLEIPNQPKAEEYMKGFPSNKSYLEKRIGPAAGLGLLLAIMSCVWCICCITCRGCAKCTECAKGSICNCCCGTAPAPEEGYTKRTRTNLFVLLLICLIVVGACCYFGDDGVQKVCDGAKVLFAKSLENVSIMSDATTIIIAGTTRLGIPGDSAVMTESVNTVKKSVKTASDQVQDSCRGGDYFDIGDDTPTYQSVPNMSKVYFGLFCINILLGFLAYCCKYSWPSSCMALLGFVLLALAWVLFASFFAGCAFLDDTCVQLQWLHECEAPGVAAANKPAACTNGDLRIQKWLKCPEVDKFQTSYDDAYDEVVKLINTYAANYPANTVKFTLPMASNLFKADLKNWEKNIQWRAKQFNYMAALVPGCSVNSFNGIGYSATCITGDTANKCPASASITPPTTPQCSQAAVLTAADVLWGASYVASCDYLTTLAVNSTAAGGSCESMADGFMYLFASHAVIGVTYCFVVGISIWAIKAWSADNYASEEPGAAGPTDVHSEQRGAPLHSELVKPFEVDVSDTRWANLDDNTPGATVGVHGGRKPESQFI